MVKHLVFWKLKNEERGNMAAHAASLNSRFKGLLGVIPGLKAVEVGINYKAGEFDLCLFCMFEDRGAESAYQIHPEHVKIKEGFVQPIICGRTAMDYEVASTVG